MNASSRDIMATERPAIDRGYGTRQVEPKKDQPTEKKPEETKTPLPPMIPPGPDCFLEVSENDVVIGQIIIHLRDDVVPQTCRNFRELLYGVKDVGSYKGTPFHRIVKDFIVQGGDVESQNGVGRKNLYGVEFDDENFDLRHSPYTISMSNVGPNTNGCIFFILLMEAPWLNEHYVVFGNVVGGFELLKQMNSNSRRSGRMTKCYSIHDCGELI